MNVISGIATASGVSSLLNSPRDAAADLRAAAGELKTFADTLSVERGGRVSGGRDAQRPVLDAPRLPSTDAAPLRKTSSDSRYERFVQAVQFLRGDYESLNTPDARVAGMMANADEVFMVGDGLPGEIVPPVIGEMELIDPIEPRTVGTADDAADAAVTIPEAVFAGGTEDAEVTAPPSTFALVGEGPSPARAPAEQRPETRADTKPDTRPETRAKARADQPPASPEPSRVDGGTQSAEAAPEPA